MSATTITSEKQSDVRVKLDDRVRLLGAVLAATDYPEQMQRVKPHGTHAHARAVQVPPTSSDSSLDKHTKAPVWLACL